MAILDGTYIVVLRLVCRRHTLPLAWRVLPQHALWPQAQITVLRIGRVVLVDTLDRRLTVPPLPFHRTPAGLVYTWLA